VTTLTAGPDPPPSLREMALLGVALLLGVLIAGRCRRDGKTWRWP
jgi:hypothetical protein